MFLMTLMKMTSWAVSVAVLPGHILRNPLYALRRVNMWFVNAELDALEADMGNETEADGVPSYLQPDKEPDLDDELNLPPAPTGAPSGRAQVSFLFNLSHKIHVCIYVWLMRDSVMNRLRMNGDYRRYHEHHFGDRFRFACINICESLLD